MRKVNDWSRRQEGESEDGRVKERGVRGEGRLRKRQDVERAGRQRDDKDLKTEGM